MPVSVVQIFISKPVSKVISESRPPAPERASAKRSSPGRPVLRKLFLLTGIFTTLVSATPESAVAAQVFLNPSADTTLIEAAPTNNMGAQTYVNAGTSQKSTRNRGLFQFNISG